MIDQSDEPTADTSATDQADTTDQGGSAPPPEGKRPRVRRPPEQTSDDTDRGWGERPDEDAHDRWLREQRPPHWE